MSDEASDWTSIVEQWIIRPDFDKAWKEISEAGPGSDAAIDYCFKLIQSSRWHREKFTNSCMGILDEMTALIIRAEDNGQIVTRASFDALGQDVMKVLMTTAAVYFVYGAMVGLGSTAGTQDE